MHGEAHTLFELPLRFVEAARTNPEHQALAAGLQADARRG